MESARGASRNQGNLHGSVVVDEAPPPAAGGRYAPRRTLRSSRLGRLGTGPARHLFSRGLAGHPQPEHRCYWCDSGNPPLAGTGTPARLQVASCALPEKATARARIAWRRRIAFRCFRWRLRTNGETLLRQPTACPHQPRGAAILRAGSTRGAYRAASPRSGGNGRRLASFGIRPTPSLPLDIGGFAALLAACAVGERVVSSERRSSSKAVRSGRSRRTSPPTG